MSKNTPTTQYLDFNNYKWNVTDSNTYTKEFDKFYSKLEGQLIIKNLSILSTKNEVTTPIADIVSVPIQVIKEKVALGNIKYHTNKIDISGGYVNIDLSYKLKENILTVKFSFMSTEM